MGTNFEQMNKQWLKAQLATTQIRADAKSAGIVSEKNPKCYLHQTILLWCFNSPGKTNKAFLLDRSKWKKHLKTGTKWKKTEIKDTMGEIKANLLIRKLFRFLITPSLTDLVEVCAIDSVAFSSAPLLFLHNQKSQAVSWTNPKFPSFRRNSAVCFHTKIGYHHYLKLNQRTQSAPFCWILCVKVLSENWRAQMYPPLRTILTNQKK